MGNPVRTVRRAIQGQQTLDTRLQRTCQNRNYPNLYLTLRAEGTQYKSALPARQDTSTPTKRTDQDALMS